MCSRHRLTSLSKNTTLSWTHFTSPIRMEGRPLRCGGRAESVHRTGARLDVKEAGVHACGEEALLLANWARTLSSEVLLLETVHRQVRTTNISNKVYKSALVGLRHLSCGHNVLFSVWHTYVSYGSYRKDTVQATQTQNESPAWTNHCMSLARVCGGYLHN